VLRADLHVHSKYSDGRNSVKEILKAALEKRLNIIAITDHNTVQGSLEAIEVVHNEQLPLIVVPGIEISAKEGHILVYGIKEDLEPGLSIKEVAEKVKKQNGVIALAHPFNFFKKGVLNPFKVINYVDAIEVFNAKVYFGITNYLAQNLCNMFKKSMIGGSDAHSVEMLGYGLTIFNGVTNSDQVLNDIKEGKTYVMGKKIPFFIQIKHSINKVIEKWL